MRKTFLFPVGKFSSLRDKFVVYVFVTFNKECLNNNEENRQMCLPKDLLIRLFDFERFLTILFLKPSKNNLYVACLAQVQLQMHKCNMRVIIVSVVTACCIDCENSSKYLVKSVLQ